MKRLLLTAVMCAAALLASTSSHARHHGPYYPPQQYSQPFTPEQWAQAQQIYAESNASMEPLLQELGSKMEILDRELATPNPDPATIEKLSREIGELRGKMLNAQASARTRLAERGLPPNYYGGWQGPYPQNGWDRYYNGGYRPYHHHGYGCGGCWW